MSESIENSQVNELIVDWGSDDLSFIEDEEDKALREIDFDDDDDDYDEVSYDFQPINLENIFDVAALPQQQQQQTNLANPKKKCCEPIYNLPEGTLGECCICFEPMNMVNLAITECAHTFHFSCLCENMKKRVQCPLCRAEFLTDELDEDEDEGETDNDEPDDETDAEEQGGEEGEEEEGEEGEEGEGEEGEGGGGEGEGGEEGEGEEEEIDQKFSIAEIAVKLTNLGYTMEDVLMMYCGSNNQADIANPRWSDVVTSDTSTSNVGSILPFTDESGEAVPRPVNVITRLERDLTLLIDGEDLLTASTTATATAAATALAVELA
jgi:hypothetical protein